MGRTCVVHDVREQARHRLELLLRAHADVDEIVATSDDDDLLARAGDGPTDLVVVGMSPNADAADLVRRLRDVAPTTAVLLAGTTERAGGTRVDVAVQRSLGLSVREVQVLIGVGRGLTNADIGRRLYLSGETVKTHAARLFRKLDATDRAEAVGRAWSVGLFVRS